MGWDRNWKRAAMAAGSALACLGGQAAAQTTSSDEIIVLGEKTRRSLQDTASSVAVVTAERIEEENIQTLFDALNRTANVTETYAGNGYTIRGIDNRGVTDGGSSGLATVYIDGVALPDNNNLVGSPLGMWDVQQVEIFRGPQSTLQGRNSLAGAIVINSRAPSYDWDVAGRATLTDAGESFALAGGGPIIADQLAFRVTLEDAHADGFVRNITRDEAEDESDSFTGRAQLLFEPGFLPDLRAVLSYSHSEHEGGYYFSYARTDAPDYYDDRVEIADALNSSDRETDIIALNASYAFSPSLTLTSISSWIDVDSLNTYDGDGTEAPISTGGGGNKTETFSQELRLNYEQERLSALFGAFYSSRETESFSASLAGIEVTDLLSALLAPDFGAAAPLIAGTYASFLAPQPGTVLVDYSSFSPAEVQTIAAFGEATFDFTPKFSMVAGFRYEREKNDLIITQTASLGAPLVDPAFGAVLDPYLVGAPVTGQQVFAIINGAIEGQVAAAGGPTRALNREFETFLPKLGATYDWTDNLSSSFVVQRGYRSGGASFNIARNSVVPYDPEFTWNYELALRSEWLDNTLTINANAFFIDWTDQQTIVYLDTGNDYDYQTENAGASQIYGFELEASHRLTEHFDWYGTLGYAQTEFTDFVVQVGGASLDLSGQEFANAPNWTAALGMNYKWTSGFSLNLNASYRAEAYGATGVEQAVYEVDPRTIVNTMFGYEAEHWSAHLFANNLFDEHYIEYPNPTRNVAMLGRPRVVGVILGANW